MDNKFIILSAQKAAFIHILINLLMFELNELKLVCVPKCADSTESTIF